MIYHKIKNVFKRSPDNNKIDMTKFYTKEIQELANNQWIFTDKIDGMNIRVYWTGYKFIYKGRTENAQLPPKLIERLDELFKNREEIFEQMFGDKEVIFYGEGYGGKIQKGAYPNKEEDFKLFDVNIGNIFLTKENVKDVGENLNLDVVDTFLTGTLYDGIEYVKNNNLVEGLIGTPVGDFLDRGGNRIIVKVKNKDFK